MAGVTLILGTWAFQQAKTQQLLWNGSFSVVHIPGLFSHKIMWPSHKCANPSLLMVRQSTRVMTLACLTLGMLVSQARISLGTLIEPADFRLIRGNTDWCSYRDMLNSPMSQSGAIRSPVGSILVGT